MYLVGLHIYCRMIHGPYNIKLINAQQAKETHKYENIKIKLYKCIAAIWYNKTCKLRKLTPRYINVRINGNNIQCRKTKSAAIHFRITQEIKFLYIKKQKLNEKLYKLHLECVSQWNVHWHTIQQMIDYKLQLQTELHYNHLNEIN